ncbi:MAG: hypothetical protein KAW45_02915 [Thermoplasmatales archaeon]|nr:hypothetical protein [Thermoplasmatales archaeon]
MKKIIAIAIIGSLLMVFTNNSIVGANNFDNNPPEIPLMPKGPSYGEIGKEYWLYTNTTDPDGDNVRYGWNFDGNYSNVIWTDYYPSRREIFYEWAPHKPGLFNISVKAEDEHGAQSSFSEVLTIFINTPPQIPDLDGPDIATTHLNSRFCAHSYDADGDPLSYMFYIEGINITDWIGPYDPGNECYLNVSWLKKGTYTIEAKCKDIHNSSSDWSMPITVAVTDLLGIRIPVINFGKVRAYILNNGRFDLKNVTWNITVQRTRLLRSINITNNDTIESLKTDKINRISTDQRIIRRLGFVNIKVEISIDELVAIPYKKTINTYGFILGRIIFVNPFFYSY